MAVNTENFNFDPDQLREKYRQERDKRLRADGNDQYKEVEGDFKYFVEDPYTKKIEKKSENLITEVAIIGGGFGGILAASRLRMSGIDDFKIIEKGGDFGGTWYWNRYPGASCDIESYIYFPLLEETKFVPKHKYTNAPETLEYIGKISEKFNLAENAIFQTEVTEVVWLEKALGIKRAQNELKIQLAESTINFIESTDGRGEGINAFKIKALNKDQIIKNAKSMKIFQNQEILLGGVKIILE